MIPPHILIIDDDPGDQRVYQDFLQIHGFEVKRVSAESEALAILADRDFEGIIIDLKKNQPSVIDLTLKCKTANPLSCIILMISDPTPSFIKNALNNGAEVCLIKPILPFMLLESIKKGIERISLSKENEKLKKELSDIKGDYAFLKERHEQMKTSIIHDPISGALNQSSINKRLESEVKRAQRHEHWMSLILIQFQFNHNRFNVEQNIFLNMARILSMHIRSVDILGRHGDGFAVIMPETDEKGAFAFTERLKKGISKPSMIGNQQKGSEERIDLTAFQKTLSLASATYPIDSRLPKKLFQIAKTRLQPALSPV